MQTTKEIDIRRSSVDLWSGILGGPIAWAINLQAKYALVPFVCHGGNAWVLPAIAAAMLLLCAGGFVFARRHHGDENPRAHAMSVAGQMLSIFFAVAIIAAVIPQFYLRPCD